jgi:hypothetical protein
MDLFLDGVGKFTDAIAKPLFGTWLPESLIHLTLHVHGSGIGKEGTKAMFAIPVTTCDKLKKFMTYGAPFDPDLIASIASTLKDPCMNVEEMSFSIVNLPKDQVPALLAGIKDSNNTLKVLHFNAAHLGKAAFEDIMRAIVKPTTPPHAVCTPAGYATTTFHDEANKLRSVDLSGASLNTEFARFSLKVKY